MSKAENGDFTPRGQLLLLLMEKSVSGNTAVEITKPLTGLPVEEKEKLASKLLAAISECKTEEEMIEAAKKVKL